MTGVDVNEELIRKSAARAGHLGADRVEFACGPIGHAAGQPGQHRLQQGAGRVAAAERGQLLLQHGVVGEGPLLGLRLQEEAERVDGGHVGNQVHRHVEVRHPLGEDDAG